ncbi:MAG: hypothetical protein EP343_14595 [Deltaproteobacteria bacterium]|nr:MAG: hypothetical protein EP343_14595 [Deltaproteobacteria bacterium]
MATEQHKDPNSKSKKRSWKQKIWSWTWKSVCSALLFLVLSPFLLLLAWQIDPVRDSLRSFGVSMARGYLQGSLKVGKLDGNLWNSLSIQDVEWRDRKGRLMVGWKKLALRYDLTSYFDNVLLVKKVTLKGLRGRVTRDKHGQLNILKHIPISPKKDPAPSKPSGPLPQLKIQVRSVALDAPSLTYQNHPSEKPRKVKNLKLRGSYWLELANLSMDAQVSTLQFQAKHPDLRAHAIKIHFQMKDQTLHLRKLRLKAGEGTILRMKGRLSLRKLSKFAVQLERLIVPPKDLKTFAPNTQLKKPIRLSLRAKGTKREIKAKLKAQLGEASLSLAGESHLQRETYKADIQLARVNLYRLTGQKKLHSKLGLTLKAKGKGFSENTEGQATLTLLPGHIQERYKIKRAVFQAQAKKGLIRLKSFSLRSPFLRAKGGGWFHLKQKTYQAKLDATVPSLYRVGKLFRESLRGYVRLLVNGKGSLQKPKGRVRLYISRGAYFPKASGTKKKTSKASRQQAPKPIKFRHLAVHAKLKSLSPLRFHTYARVRRLRVAEQRLRLVKLFAGAKLSTQTQRFYVRLSRLDLNFGSGLFRLRKTAYVRGSLKSSIRIRRFVLAHRNEQLQVNGFVNWKRGKHQLQVKIKQLNLSPLQRAFFPKVKPPLRGRLSASIATRGTFHHPKLNLGLGLRALRLDRIQPLSSRIRLQWNWNAKSRKKVLLHAHVQTTHRRQKLVVMRATVPFQLLLGKAAKKNAPLFKLPLQQKMALSLNIPGLHLRKFRKLFPSLKMDGHLKGSVKLHNNLSQPKLDVALKLRRGRFGKYRRLAANVFLHYRKGRLQLSRQGSNAKSQSTYFQLKGKTVARIAGDLPLILRTYRQGSGYKFSARLKDKAMKLRASFVRQDLGRLLRAIQPKVHKQVASIRGQFTGDILVTGKPTRPKLKAHINIEKGSFCPWTNTGFVCKLVVRKSTNGEPTFQKKGDITKVLAKVADLRIRGVGLKLQAEYKPSSNAKRPGRLTVSSQLMVENKQVLALGNYAKNASHCSSLQKQKPQDTKQESVFFLNVSLNPKTFVPSFELYDDVRLALSLSKLRFKQLKRWVRIGSVRRLYGNLSAEIAFCGLLNEPDIDAQVRLDDFKYSLGTNVYSRKVEIDKAKLDVEVGLHKGILQWKVAAHVLEQPLLQTTGSIRNLNLRLDRNNLKFNPQWHRADIDAEVDIPGFEIQALAEKLGYKDRIYGKIRSHLHIKGDPSCLELVKNSGKHKESSDAKAEDADPNTKEDVASLAKKSHNHLSIENLYVGISRSAYRKLRKQDKDKDLAALDVKLFQLKMKSLKQGRLLMNLGLWKKRPPGKEPPDMLTGEAQLPIPLSMLPAEAKQLVSQKRCTHWPDGSPNPKLKVAISQNQYALPLRFLEPFLPGTELNAGLVMSLNLKGTLENIEQAKGFARLRIQRIAVPKHGLALVSNATSQTLKEKDPEAYKRCRSLLHTKNQNKKTKVYDKHIDGCTYSYIKVSLGEENYLLRGRLQGESGKPLLLQGKLSRAGGLLSFRNHPSYSAKFTAEDFRPMDTRKHKLVLHTKMTARKKEGSAPTIDGELVIDQLLYHLPSTTYGDGYKEYKQHPDLVILGETSERKLYPSNVRQSLRNNRWNSITKKQNQKLASGLPSSLKKRLQKTSTKQGASKSNKSDTSSKRKRKRKRKKPKPPLFQDDLRANIIVKIPHNARVKGRELDLSVRSLYKDGLRVVWKDRRLRLVGGLRVVRGGLTLYTKSFTTTENSRIQFMGQSLRLDELDQLNAKLNVTARHRVRQRSGGGMQGSIKRVDILVKIRGTLQNPKVSLGAQTASGTSMSMDKANILSMLLTGATTQGLSEGQNVLGQQAFSAASSIASSIAQTYITQAIPIDVFKIDAGSRVEDLEVTIGKYITQKLYLEIQSRPFPEDTENLWMLLFQAQLSRHWRLELQVGEKKRNNEDLFRSAAYIYFQMRR